MKIMKFTLSTILAVPVLAVPLFCSAATRPMPSPEARMSSDTETSAFVEKQKHEARKYFSEPGDWSVVSIAAIFVLYQVRRRRPARAVLYRGAMQKNETANRFSNKSSTVENHYRGVEA